jgi:excisionase family DNA binding protein
MLASVYGDVPPRRNAMARVMTLDEVAQYLRVHPSTVYRLLKKKELPGFKMGSDWRFNLESIDRWLEMSEAQSAHR